MKQEDIKNLSEDDLQENLAAQTANLERLRMNRFRLWRTQSN